MKIRISKQMEEAVVAEVVKNLSGFEKFWFNKQTWRLAAKKMLESGMRVDAAIVEAKHVANRNTVLVLLASLMTPFVVEAIKDIREENAKMNTTEEA